MFTCLYMDQMMNYWCVLNIYTLKMFKEIAKCIAYKYNRQRVSFLPYESQTQISANNLKEKHIHYMTAVH